MHPITPSLLEPISPPSAFGIVEPELTRLKEFVDQTSIKFCHQGLKAWRPELTWKPVSDELVKDSLEFILNVENHPVMIMCSSGIHETGILVGCLRRLQFWNMASIIEEHRRYAGAKSRFVNEQYIEFFDIDLVTLPLTLPSWFINQIQFFQNLNNHKEGKSKNNTAINRYSLRPATYGPLISTNACYDPSKSIVIDDAE